MNESNLFIVPDVPEVDGPTVLFEHWVLKMKTGRRGPKPAFTPARKKLLAKWFDYYDLPTLTAAIDGCALSDFHMGNNSRGRRYDSLELIFRDAEHIERFASIAMEADDQEVDW